MQSYRKKLAFGNSDTTPLFKILFHKDFVAKDAGFGEDDLAGRQETVDGVEEVGVVKDAGLGEDDPGDDHGQPHRTALHNSVHHGSHHRLEVFHHHPLHSLHVA